MSHTIHPTSIIANCTLGAGVVIGPFCMLTDSIIGENTTIEGSVLIHNSHLEKNTEILWGSIIRDSHLSEGCVIGAEVKKSHLGKSNKAKHPGTNIVSATTGEKVNFGGGVKCANYDGRGKGFFRIGDGVFLGCNCVLSVKADQTRVIGNGTKIGANTHIDIDIPESSLVYNDRTSGTLVVREGYFLHS